MIAAQHSYSKAPYWHTAEKSESHFFEKTEVPTAATIECSEWGIFSTFSLAENVESIKTTLKLPNGFDTVVNTYNVHLCDPC